VPGWQAASQRAGACPRRPTLRTRIWPGPGCHRPDGGAPDARRTVKDNIQVKEVNVGTDDRFVLCYNPAQAERDAAVRALLIAQLEEVIKDTDKVTKTERARIEGSLADKPGLRRFLRVTPGGLLRVDKQKIKTETNLDGKYLLRCSDPPSPPRTSPSDISSCWKLSAAGAT
jgi:hypothetical protein